MFANCMQGQGVYLGPLAELDFWSERAGNLNAIHEQLSNERIQKVAKILELANSAYHQVFQRLFQVCVAESAVLSARTAV
jgi:dynein heavy chain